MLLADAPQAPVVDYYAGAVAFLAFTMFARVAIHKTKERAPGKEGRAGCWHVVCVVGSALGIVAALPVLGFDDRNQFGGYESALPILVAAAATLAAVVLAVEICTTSAVKTTPKP